MIRLAGELGVSPARCIAGTGLCEDELADPLREIGGQQELGVLRNILCALPRETPFALLAGQRYRLTTHGMWGFTIMSHPTIGSAVEFGLRYFDLSFSFNRVSLEIRGHEARLLYDDSDNPDDLRAALVERDIAALIAFQRSGFGRAFAARSLHLRAPRPPYATEFASLFGVAAQFNAAENYIAYDSHLLETPTPRGDESGMKLGEEQCRLLLERSGERSGLAGKVRRRILRKPSEIPSMKTVAAELGMSTRTLHNQLNREATSYSALLEEIRKTQAEELLSTTHLTVNELAERLGYSDTSSFIAAFKRWTGVSPRDYKRKLAKSQGTP